MSAVADPAPAGRIGRLSTFLYLRPRLVLLLLLLPPLLWLGIVYVGSLLALLAQSFFSAKVALSILSFMRQIRRHFG